MNAVVDFLLAQINPLLELLRPNPWTVEEIATLPEGVDEGLLLGGAGLSNDGSAAWTEQVNKDPSVVMGRFPGPGPGTFSLPVPFKLFQLDDHQVDVSIGGMNDSHEMVGTARTRDVGALSQWAICLKPEGGVQNFMNPIDADAQHAATDVDNSGWIVGGHSGLTGAVPSFWANDQVALPVDLPTIGGMSTAVNAVSPTTQQLAGAWAPLDNPAAFHPWFGTQAMQTQVNFPGQANDINDIQTSCGENWSDNGSQRVRDAWRFSTARGMTWMFGLTVNGARQQSTARALNKHGDTVGISGPNWNALRGNRAVYWPAFAREPVDLTAQIQRAHPDITLNAAVRVNDNLDILCFGTGNDATGTQVNKVFLVHYTGLRLVFP